MRKYLMMLILALTVVSFSTAANAAIGTVELGGGVINLSPQNYGGNKTPRVNNRGSYNDQVREANRNSQRKYDQQTIFNQNQHIINQLNQQEQCCNQLKLCK